ncbi:MAG: MBL fold metallo-hydrolase [Nannocystis sp.]|nr:MBL fold metallo-hydrolase [Nannocystis sp.]
MRNSILLLPLLSACTGSTAGSTAGDGEDAQAFPACDEEFTVTEANPTLPWTPDAITLTSRELAPGVFVVYDRNADEYGPAGIPLATSGGFVIGDDGVLLVETMINRQLFCQMIDLVRAQTDKPVLYAINTSYHGDHNFGNAYLPEEVAVVQHERTAAHIAAHFEADIAFMEAAFGADQGIAETARVDADILVSDAGWSVDLGGLEVEARYHGFGQTEGDLFVYVPAARVLWTGNPLIAEAPAIPWLLDGRATDVRATLAAVKASLPADAIVVPGHSHPLTSAGFDWSVDYLDTLVGEVQAALDGGETLEEAQASVTMDAFHGYALWDWIHTTINVPKTYSELGGG